MSSHPFYDRPGVVRNDTLETDAIIRDTRRAFVRGTISRETVITLLRDAGACESEIAETVS